MNQSNYPEIRDLAVIGDRRTLAIVTKTGAVVWYCPGRFDYPSLLGSLLDAEKGGNWTIEAENTQFSHRSYLENSGVLETTLITDDQEWKITDWMPFGKELPGGICRQISPVPRPVKITLNPAPDYARQTPKLKMVNEHTVEIDEQYYFYSSHPLEVKGDSIQISLPAGERAGMALLEHSLASVTEDDLKNWLSTTLENWRDVASQTTYSGLYEKEVANSLRALRLLTFEENGGILAAGTTSLPEAIGKDRNYDYRYVWLRDADMIVSALIRAGSDGTQERRFLGFICGLGRGSETMPVAPVLQPSGEIAPDEESLDHLTGYCNSQPVLIGNHVRKQLQLDTLGNVLLAAKLIYNRFDTREHWSLTSHLADYLAENWHKSDYGIWEERVKKQFTVSKVIAACGLHYLADITEDEEQAQRWRTAEQEIRDYVAKECISPEGAYTAVAGGAGVDVSAALFPVWGYTDPDTPEMIATMKVLERDYATGHFYRRHLEQGDSREEGAFLAGMLWVAQYWVMRGDLERVRAIVDETLKYSNDLGLFAEEADPKTGQMIGNIPQTFVHASLIGVVIDLQEKLSEEK